jgi:hypothetical protein
MSDHKFNCPACGQKIACDSGAADTVVNCPACQSAISVPPVPRSAPKPSAARLQTKAAADGVTVQTGSNYCGLAIASVICSVVFLIGWLPGIICGHIAKARIRRNPLLDGETMANVGLAISYLWLLVIPAVSVAFALNRQNLTPQAIVRNQADAVANLERRMVDEVVIGDADSENLHRLERGGSNTGVWQGRHWRGVEWSASIFYTMKVLPDQRMSLNCHFGDNPGDRHFDVYIEGQQIGAEVFKFNVPGHFYDVEYTIPAGLTRGKNNVRVEFRAPLVMTPARLYGCQTLKP